jgi:hypothetical protein
MTIRDRREKTPEATQEVERAPAAPLATIQRKLGNSRMVQLREQHRTGGEPPLPDWLGGDAHDVAAHGVRGGGEPLPHLDTIQRAFGHHDVSGVRSHVGGPAADSAEELGAVAYASGDAVAFADTPDVHLAAHEAAHVVQQRGGVRLSDGVGRSDDEYERHADAVADKVVRGESAQPLLDQMAHRGAAGGPAVQRRLPHAGGGSAPGASPPIPREPNPAPQIDRLRQLMLRSARDKNVSAESVDRAIGRLTASITQMLTSGAPGSVPCEPEPCESQIAGMDYVWTLRGEISHGNEDHQTTAHGRGTIRSERGGDTALGTNDTDRTLTRDTVTGRANAAENPGQEGGPSYGGGVEGQAVDELEHTHGRTRADTARHLDARSMQANMDHTDYLMDVSLSLEFSLSLSEGSWMSPMAGLMGAAAGTSPDFASPIEGHVGAEVIGSIAGAHEAVSAPSHGGGGRRLPQRIR